MIKICKTCFKPFKGRVDRGTYCSHECRWKKEGKKKEVLCKICNMPFIGIPTRNKYCDKNCLGIANKIRQKGVPHTTWNLAKGDQFSSWKGDKVGYRALHSWVRRWKGIPDICEKCGNKGTGHKMHWANKSKKYLRDLSDWVRLCAKCHKDFDKS